jgi:tRNA pseudouridine13 synthase
MNCTYLTPDLPGTGGVLKQTPEDFRVDEIPLYAPSGEGEHVFARLRKRGVATFEAARRVAQAVGVPERYVTFAGLKDARAVTTQTISIFGATVEQVAAARVPGIELSDIHRHANGLRLGHLRGNRFDLVVRDAQPDTLPRARAVLEVLIRKGVPNYYGEQRFGARADGHLFGKHLLNKDYGGFLKRMLGGPAGTTLDPNVLEARRLFDAGDLQGAYDAMPIRQRAEKKALGALLRFKDEETAVRAIPKRIRKIYVSAFQSWLFNQTVAGRIDALDRLMEGDLAYIHRSRRVFLVEDAGAEQPRCDALEISPSGPMFGTRMTNPAGEPGRVEHELLASTGLTPEEFHTDQGIKVKGLRRPLRVPLRDVSIEPVDATSYRVRFTLPSGSFATVVMAELIKD